MEIPEGFTVIEFDLFHASKVGSINFPFLATLNLRTIVVLDSGAPSRSLSEFADAHKIQLVHLVTEAWRSASNEQQQMLTVHSHALKYVLDARNYPVLVLGTSLITGIIRRLENWSFSPIMSEYSALSEVSGTFIKLADMCAIELMEFEAGSIEDAQAIIKKYAGPDLLRSVVVVDLPPKEFRAEWVKNYKIDFPTPKSKPTLESMGGG